MEINASQAGQALGMTDQAVRDHVNAGRLKARRVGMRRIYTIRVEDLKDFARKYSYDLDLSQIRDE